MRLSGRKLQLPTTPILIQNAAGEHCNRTMSSATEHWMATKCLRHNAYKTEPMSTSAKHNLLKFPGGVPSLTLGGANTKSSDVIRLPGVLLTPNLSMDKHVTSLSAKWYNYVISDVRCRHNGSHIYHQLH